MNILGNNFTIRNILNKKITPHRYLRFHPLQKHEQLHAKHLEVPDHQRVTLQRKYFQFEKFFDQLRFDLWHRLLLNLHLALEPYFYIH